MSGSEKRRLFIPRPGEWSLILWTLPVIVVLFMAAACHRMSTSMVTEMDFVLPGALLGSVLLAHLILVTAGSRSDDTLLPVWFVLLATGLVTKYRLGVLDAESWLRPAEWTVVAAPVVVALCAVIPGNKRIEHFRKLTWLWIICAIGACVFVTVSGITFRGGVYGPGKTTPTEIVKPLLILGFAGLLTKYGKHINRGQSLLSFKSREAHVLILGSWFTVGVFLILLRDLGMLAATGALCIALLTLTTGRIIYLATGSATIIFAGWLFKEFVHKGQVRFSAWLTPFEHPDSSGFQTVRSLFALFNGEFFGKGIGNGFPQTIPLADTDFIYAAMAEEYGWIGTLLLLILAWRIVRAGLYHGSQSRDIYSALICVGCATVWCIQLVLHIGGVIKLIPMTGVPYPGLSSGGTAIIVFSIMIGWIMAVSDGNQRS